MPKTQPSGAMLWAMFASGALHSCSNGIGAGKATTSEGRTIQAAREADLMLLQFQERYEWYDGGSYTGWKPKERNNKK